MLKFRRDHKSSLVFGAWETFDLENEETFTYTKRAQDGSETLAIVLNFSGKKQEVNVPGKGKKELLMSSARGSVGENDALQPYEGRIYKIE